MAKERDFAVSGALPETPELGVRLATGAGAQECLP